ncbi:hypothetical protein PCYB_095060 [Plasmodium cynomolgi strain B]|uniref:Uncharacterized protein n=1 Tax=Plasmodium cynomolgi (strain B) TaxID=1120755 RepID=K6VBZ2_PLACD|nr:hypothetical protein PCYB_095060 [Plasmodium cynomolgi strain B]GAB66722.1 hypothetical protein PCYB_095060 [Plasmodium cynomolgi strain B]
MGKNKTSGESSDRANYSPSQDAIAGVPLIGWEAESVATPKQQRDISYREAKNGKKGIPPSIASNSDNKTGSSRSCWSYAPPKWNAQKKKHTHVNDNHIVETKKAYTSISTAPHRSNYTYRADPRTKTESSSPRICLVKRLNGKLEQIDMKDIQTAFPNYIPYERNDNGAFLSSVFSPVEDTEQQTQGKVGDISNLPVVIRQGSAKSSAKIKLPIGTPPTSQTGKLTRVTPREGLGKALHAGERAGGVSDVYSHGAIPWCYPMILSHARGSHQKAPPPSRSFSCNNTIYNPSACNPSNGLRSTSQKRTFSNVQTSYNSPGGGSNFSSCGQSPIRRFQSAQNATTLSLRSPKVVTPKRDATPQTSLLKPYAIPMLLKHSTNMILNQLKKKKGNQRTHTKGTNMNVRNKDKQKEVQFESNSFSKKKG